MREAVNRDLNWDKWHGIQTKAGAVAMKISRKSFLKSLTLFSSLCLFSAPLAATTIDSVSDNLDQRDINALREWINTKRQVTVREMGGALSISGEVRTELQSTSETVNGVQQRSNKHVRNGTGDDAVEFPRNAYDVEVNIMLDYRTEGSWASIKLEFDNDAGVFSGTLNKLKLERAIWGVRVIDGDTYYFDAELGRRRLSMMLDSKLEFNSFFDGVWFRYDQGLDSIGDIYAHAGVFVINDARNQYGYVGELGFLNIGNTGLYAKYSLIDWNTKNLHDKDKDRVFDFIVSQFLIGYKFMPKKLQKVVQIYAAGLWNASAHKLHITNNTKANLGGYLGISMGELKKKGDWAIDANYQVLQAQCVPNFDTQGIGLGNVGGNEFYYVKEEGKRVASTEPSQPQGNVNYRGFQITFDYLILNQLDFQQSWQQSITLDKNIGPFRRYKQYEMEFIYGF